MDENPLKYKKSHKADYEEENVEVKENRGHTLYYLCGNIIKLLYNSILFYL